MTGLFPIVTFEHIPLPEANALLVQWKHRMGPLCRPQFSPCHAYALCHEEKPVALATSSQLITATMGKELPYMTRSNTVELSRLCACRPRLCRVVLRLWREFVFVPSGYEFAVSYQDADLHSGNTYRFDGWQCVGSSRSGTDMRSGLKGRNKKIWQYPPNAKGGET